MLEYQGAMWLLWFKIGISAAFLGKNAYDKIITMSQNEHQLSVNNLSSCIVDNLMAMKRSKPATNLLAAYIDINASDEIASASYNWALAERQQFL